jgi:hypothetical protein
VSGLAHVVAVAGLRVRQGIAARLGWIVALGFLVGLGAAVSAPGADEAARAATADRMALGAVGALAVLAALVAAATTIPAEIRDGSADRLLASPVSRAAVVVGGVLGHGALATMVLVGGLGAALLGLEAGGLGAGARAPVRAFLPGNPGRALDVLRETGSAQVALDVPDAHVPADELVLRLSPRAVNEGGELERITRVPLTLGQPGGEELTLEAGWAPGREIVARFPAAGLQPGRPVHLTIHRPAGTWGLHVPAGAIEVGGAPQLFMLTSLKAALCLAPLLFLFAAAGGLGAARFNAPTALGIGFFVLVVFTGQDVLREGAAYVIRAAETAREAAAEAQESDDGHDHGDHDHGEHDHAPAEVSGLQESLAHATLAGLDLLPPLDAFDRTDDVLAGRDVPARDGGRAALLVLPGLGLLLAGSWLLLARRDLLPT